MFTLAQLGYHTNPCGILNINHYFDKLLDFLDHVVAQGFLSPSQHERIIVDDNAENLIFKLETYQLPSNSKWN